MAQAVSLFARDDGGAFVPLEVDSNGNLRVAYASDAAAQTVGLDAASLAALETITANQGTAGTSAWLIDPKRYGPKVGSTPGVYQALTTANTAGAAVAVPTGAKRLTVWSERSTSDSTFVRGRIGFDTQSATAPVFTATDTVLGYLPPGGGIFDVPSTSTHVWFGSATTNAVVYGHWET